MQTTPQTCHSIPCPPAARAGLPHLARVRRHEVLQRLRRALRLPGTVVQPRQGLGHLSMLWPLRLHLQVAGGARVAKVQPGEGGGKGGMEHQARLLSHHML
jgi:hypothetical protein